MQRFRELRQAIRVSLSRLTQREQMLIVGGGLGGACLVALIVTLLVGSAITSLQHRLEVKTGQLAQVLALRGEYAARQEERAQRMRTLSSSNVRLVSLVEDAARQAGIEIGQLRPEDGEASPDGVVESRVDLRASGLSIDRLQEFLNLLEAGHGIVLVRHLKVVRPYHKDVAEMELTVSTYKIKTT
jgi:hypothetical protein